MPSFLPAVVASRFSSRSKGKERVSERGKPAEINIGVPMAVRHEGHVSKSGDHKFSPHTRVANQLGDGEVDWLKSEARNSGRAQNSRYDSWADNVNDEEQSARARTAWAKAGAAGLAAGSHALQAATDAMRPTPIGSACSLIGDSMLAMKQADRN